MSNHLSFNDLDTQLIAALNEHDLLIAFGTVDEPTSLRRPVDITTFLAFFDVLTGIEKEKDETSLYLHQVTLIDLNSDSPITGKMFKVFHVNAAQDATLRHQLLASQG